MRPSSKRFTGIAAALIGLSACDSKQADLAREFPPPRLAHQTRAPQKAIRMVPAPGSHLQVELRAENSKLQLQLRALRGFLELHPQNLKASRGELRADLTTLRSTNEGSGATETLRWLGLETGRASRHARFELREVIRTSASALHLGAKRREDGQLTGEVQLTVRGNLELAGYRREQTAKIRLRFPYQEATPDLTRLEISSLRPMRIALKSHGITPPTEPVGGSAEKTAGRPQYRTAHASLSLSLLATEE